MEAFPPMRCYGAQQKERARDNMKMHLESGMTSCLQGTKGYWEPEPRHLLMEENVRGLWGKSKSGGGLMQMRIFMLIRTVGIDV